MDDFDKEKERKTVMNIILRAQEEKRAQILAQKLNLPYINLLKVPIEIDALSKVKEEKARAGLFLPFEIKENVVGIATLNPDDEILRETLKKLENLGYKTKIFICSLSSLKRGFEEYKKVRKLQKKITEEIEISSENIEEIKKSLSKVEEIKEKLNQNKNNTTTFIEILMASALRFNASDIHIVPGDETVLIKYRIDGILHDIILIDKKFYQSLLSRIKLLSDLKINIHDVAQDGRFSVKLEGKDVEIRVSVVPGEYGEDVVMRILDPKMLLSVEELGFHSWHQEMILHQIKKTIGMILTCGPTGSGKTTTLYACLKKIATGEVKVLTIEDPIEYHLENVDQTQVEHEKGYNFAMALRAAMRQDPDVILVGEIRDPETASAAIQAAQTGHLVFSTLHTNDAAGIVPRLIELGISGPAIASSLNLAISQRLLRRICKNCVEEVEISGVQKDLIKKNLELIPKPILEREEIRKIIEPILKESNLKLKKGKGCEKCFNTGYKGRIGIYEMFKMTPRIEETISMSPSVFEMKKAMKEEGFSTLQQDALLRVIEGITSIEELERVTGPLE